MGGMNLRHRWQRGRLWRSAQGRFRAALHHPGGIALDEKRGRARLAHCGRGGAP